MNKLILACVKFLGIKRPYRVILQNRIKNPDWFAYHNVLLDDSGKILRHNIHITMEDVELYHLDTIIAHEFVHAWKSENGINGEFHCKHFQRMAEKLKNHLLTYGFNIGDIYRPDIDK